MVKCPNCGRLIDESNSAPSDLRSPCPSCGLKARLYTIELTDELTLREKLKAKARHGRLGEVKPFLEVQTGDDFHRKIGRWNHREKVENRDNNRYFEHIVNPRTGDVVHHCVEPLTQHQGHGTAKRTRLPERDHEYSAVEERIDFTRAAPVKERCAFRKSLSNPVKLRFYGQYLFKSLKRLKPIVQKVSPRFSKLSWWVIGVVFGALITHQVDSFLDRPKDHAELARYYVASMPPHCRASSSLELDHQIKRFIEATGRSRTAAGGIPVWREDCSIGAHFSKKFEENLGLTEQLFAKQK